MALPETITSTRTAAEHRGDHQTLHVRQNQTFNVKDYGALGDGTTDDTTEIQAALDAVPAAGGAVFFPVGIYIVSAPLVPKNHTRMFGNSTPRYATGNLTLVSTEIRLGASFAGAGMVSLPGTTRGVSIDHIGLAGNRVGTNVHGIRFPDIAAVTGEMAVYVDNVQIQGFTGSGMYGRLHVGILTNLMIMDNLGYGIECASGTNDRWNDVKVGYSYLAFNRKGGVGFVSNGTTAGVSFISCRLERSGQVAQNPENNPADAAWNADAAGARISRGYRISFTNCDTDANTGPGFDVTGTVAGSSAFLTDISFTSCVAGRDGGGDQTVNPTANGVSSGFRVRGFSSIAADVAKFISFTNCTSTTGKSKDSGPAAGAPTSPAYGLYLSSVYQSQWSMTIPTGNTAAIQTSGETYGCGVLYVDLAGALKYLKGNASGGTTTTLVA